MNKLFRLAAFTILGIFFVIILGIVFSRIRPISVNCVNCNLETGIGTKSAIQLEFSKPVDPEKVEKSWQVEPQTNGFWEWSDNQHASWLANPFLQVDQSYTFSIKENEIGIDGNKAKNDLLWTVLVRDPKIMFLQSSQSNDANGNEIYYIDPDPNQDSETIQLTHTSGSIFDYNPSHDGEMIVFSMSNDEEGRDLWIINRDGADMHKVLACESDLCSSPVFSPDGKKAAFVREQYDSNSGASSKPVLWLLDLENSQAMPLVAESEITGISPTWSSNGEWISFWETQSEIIFIVNQLSGEILTIESSQGNAGCWSNEGNDLYYPKMEFKGATFFNVIQRANIDESTIKTVFEWDGTGSFASYENPTCHPAKSQIGVTIQRNVKIPGKEIAVLDTENQEIITVKIDMTKIPGYLSWSPTGSQLMFQLNTFSQDNENAVYIWDVENESSTRIVENVYAPKWLP